MVEIKDFDTWSVYDGAAEGSGRSEKIWLISPKGEVGLFKFPKIMDIKTQKETSEHISEHLASKIGLRIGVTTANVDIGTYKGRIGSMSYLVRTENETLIEGISFISGIFPKYNANTMKNEENGEYYCIDNIFQSTQKVMNRKAWIEMMIFDFLIGNADRHQSNWAVLARFEPPNKVHVRKCPLYDNGSSLCCYVNDLQLEKMFGKDPGPFNALTDSKSRSIIRIDGTKKACPTHKEVVKYLLFHYPESKEICHRAIALLDHNTIEELLSEYPPSILDPRKKELIKRFLVRKISLLTETLMEVCRNAKQ